MSNHAWSHARAHSRIGARQRNATMSGNKTSHLHRSSTAANTTSPTPTHAEFVVFIALSTQHELVVGWVNRTDFYTNRTEHEYHSMPILADGLSNGGVHSHSDNILHFRKNFSLLLICYWIDGQTHRKNLHSLVYPNNRTQTQQTHAYTPSTHNEMIFVRQH